MFYQEFPGGLYCLRCPREARSREELEGLKGTKYVQSRLEGVYRRIAALLREDEWVLFSSTGNTPPEELPYRTVSSLALAPK